ncbi:MAG: hypothetical protein Q7U13_10700 [Rhodoferax sp.]|nr:hypothetical protein [Rhodoferax sp.]
MTERFSVPRGLQRIVCLSEETTEWLYLLAQLHCIVMDRSAQHG